MKTFPPDILTVKTKAGVRHWLAHHVVVQMGGYSEEYLWKIRSTYKETVPQSQRGWAFMPDTGHVWRWARKHGTFYYALDNLPRRLRDMARAYVEDVHSQGVRTLRQEIEQYIRDHLNDWLPVYAGESYKRAKELATAACVVDFLAAHFPERGRKALLEEVVRFRYAYIPKTWLTLYRKVRAYMDGVPMDELIRLPRYGNRNALRYDDDEVLAWIYRLRSDGRNYTDAYIIRKVRQLAHQYGKDVPSVSWIQRVLSDYATKLATAKGRYGSGRLANRWTGHLPVARPMYAGDVWHVDATRLNLLEHYITNEKTGKQERKFLFIIAVRDGYSGDVLGVTFDYKEDRWSVLNAVKMAVNEAGYLPYEIVFDRFPGHNTPEAQMFFNELRYQGVKVTFAHSATGKAPLERWFSTLQTVFMQDSDAYYGEGIQSRRASAHRSPEYLDRMRRYLKKAGWDLQAAVAEATRIVETYRHTPFSEWSEKYKHIDRSPSQLHKESEKPNVRTVNDVIYWRLFSYKKEIGVPANGLLETTIYGQQLYYQIEEYEIIAKHRKVWIGYMPEELDRVYLYQNEGGFWAVIGQARAVEPVQLYGPEAEYNRLAKLKKLHREFEERRKADLEEKIRPALETDLLMGRLTIKEDAEATETALLISGDDVMMSFEDTNPAKQKLYKKPPPDAMPGDDDWLLNQF